MTFTRFESRCCNIGWHCSKVALALAVILGEASAAPAAEISVGAPQLIYTKSQRKSAGGTNWPDGNLGVVAVGNGIYDFYGANGPKPVMSVGTLDNPGISKQSVSIIGLPKKTFDYVSGGPVFEDPYSGARLMVYHAEVQKSSKNFYSMLGLAISTDPSGQTFRDLGIVVQPNLPSGAAEVGGGSFAVVNGYFNIYYKDWLADGTTSEVAVARAPMADLISNAILGKSTAFTKYYNGSFSQPGLGGKSSYLEPLNPANSWLSVSYNDYFGKLMMVSSQWSGDGGDLYYTTSPDGIHWAPRQPLAVDPGEQFYPSIVGTGNDPTHSGQSFYVYYTDSAKGAWSRWSDAQLLRRQITINSPDQSATGTLNGGLGYSAEWESVSGFQADFQNGAPKLGWKYAWDPSGKVGKSSAYSSLIWSNTAQAYNTTGGATTVPSGKKGHHDDYLSLSAIGGSPGNPKYLPMAGYTIQADDGAGLYRITDSSIQKANNTLFPKEDGLQVLVYVNDTLIGSGYNVSPDGTLASFDQSLGVLNVGDTVWVMVDPLKNQLEDSFINFDFTIQKLVFFAQDALNGAIRRLEWRPRTKLRRTGPDRAVRSNRATTEK